jgi:hypothetical protein
MADRIDIERFRALVESYGVAPARWPEAERQAASALLDVSAEARALVDAEAGLDAALDQVPALAPSAALMGRILRALPGPGPSWRDLVFGAMPVWRPATAFALALLLGLGFGWTGAWPPVAPTPVEIDIAAIAFPSNGEEGVN